MQGNTISLNWQTTLLEQEKNQKKEQERSAPYYKYVEQNPDHLLLQQKAKLKSNSSCFSFANTDSLKSKNYSRHLFTFFTMEFGSSIHSLYAFFQD